MWSLSRALYRVLRELYREPLAGFLVEFLAELLVEPLTQFLPILYLTKSLLIYNNSSLKLDFIFNFLSY